MSSYVLGPELALPPHAMVCEANKRSASTLGVSGRSDFYVTLTAVAVVIDREKSVQAADVRKLVASFDAVRRKLKQPALTLVLLLGRGQKLCSKTDNDKRARPMLVANSISVYRLE